MTTCGSRAATSLVCNLPESGLPPWLRCLRAICAPMIQFQMRVASPVSPAFRISLQRPNVSFTYSNRAGRRNLSCSITSLVSRNSRAPIFPIPFAGASALRECLPRNRTFPLFLRSFRLRSVAIPALGSASFCRTRRAIADDLTFIKTVNTEEINHDPAVTMAQTGFRLGGRPSMGAWISYGLGCETQDLPAFVVMISSSGGGQPLYDRLWGTAFLPSRYQGVKFRSIGDPVLYLSDPKGFSSGRPPPFPRCNRQTR